jgi:hypothetical protein
MPSKYRGEDVSCNMATLKEKSALLECIRGLCSKFYSKFMFVTLFYKSSCILKQINVIARISVLKFETASFH